MKWHAQVVMRVRRSRGTRRLGAVLEPRKDDDAVPFRRCQAMVRYTLISEAYWGLR